MPPTPDDPLQSPQESDTEPGVTARPPRPPRTPLASVSTLPYRRSNNASLSNLFASTTSLPTLASLATPTGSGSGTVTPPSTTINGSVFSPTGSTARSSSPVSVRKSTGSEVRDVVLRAFAPHVSVLASQDTEELIRHKGISGGLLELLRPFGEHVQGKVTVRDSAGVSRSWEDFAVRFVGVKDGLEPPRSADRKSTDSAATAAAEKKGFRASLLEYKPAKLRTGGDVPQIEELVERHLTFAEEHSGPVDADYISMRNALQSDPNSISPFYMLYLRRLLSGLPVVPSETFAHPVAAVIAISSRSSSPIEELRNLYDSSNTGEHRLPQWVHNEFLRYYVLIHDEDYDDITKSMALYDQMKRHFGLHCHLLRLRSTQCVPSDDDSLKLSTCEWISATEELAEIIRRETNDDDEDPTPCIFESDASALRAFVREMVTQSIIPSMERASATWNDQVASRRRGISGRFMSLSKRFTGFGNRNSTGSNPGSSGSNYDSLQGFYRPDAPEAIIRKLADYAMMLRDYKLAQSTYEILCSDFKSDKAWRHYAGANEMAAVSALLAITNLSSKVRIESIDQYLETAYYSYLTRVGAPYYALRTLLLGVELLKIRGGSALDDAARWCGKVLDDRLVGPIGHALVMERIAASYTERKGVGPLQSGDRRRKSAFWNMLTTDTWLRLGKTSQAEQRLKEATRLYALARRRSGGAGAVDADKNDAADDKLHSDNVGDNSHGVSTTTAAASFGGMASFLAALQHAVAENRSGPRHIDGERLLDEQQAALVEPLQQQQQLPSSDNLAAHTPGALPHRRSLSTAAPPPGLQKGFEPAAPSSSSLSSPNPHAADAPPQSPGIEKKDPRAEGFE